MSPPTTDTRNFRRFLRTSSNLTIDRCYFLIIHFIFYIIILILVYIRLGQFNNKQEKIFNSLHTNHNLTFHEDFQSRLINHDQ